MIAAILPHNRPVEVLDADPDHEIAHVRSIGRANLDIRYIGGKGYVPTPYADVDTGDLLHVTALDPDECDELANWMAAMEDVNALADEHSPDLAAAMAIEDRARQAFMAYVESHELQRREA